MCIQDYNPRDWKSHPPYTFIAYGSSVKRGPLKRLVPIQQTLSEITGPLFMSYPVVSNVQYRLSEVDGGTLIKFHHTALGLIQEDHREGVGKGWTHIHARVRARAEGNRSRSASSE